MSKKKTEETYSLTFRGLLDLYLPYKTSDEIYSAIELSCRRNGWGIAINEENRLDFVQMRQVEDKQ